MKYILKGDVKMYYKGTPTSANNGKWFALQAFRYPADHYIESLQNKCEVRIYYCQESKNLGVEAELIYTVEGDEAIKIFENMPND
jgi:hypothetical protein